MLSILIEIGVGVGVVVRVGGKGVLVFTGSAVLVGAYVCDGEGLPHAESR